jgi:hypothetical protein
MERAMPIQMHILNDIKQQALQAILMNFQMWTSLREPTILFKVVDAIRNFLEHNPQTLTQFKDRSKLSLILLLMH